MPFIMNHKPTNYLTGLTACCDLRFSHRLCRSEHITVTSAVLFQLSLLELATKIGLKEFKEITAFLTLVQLAKIYVN
jgi:hypothetical protein